MSTLLFCTSFSANQTTWSNRYRRWLDYNKSSGLIYDQALIVDDCSPVLPEWNDVQILTKLADDAIRPPDPNILVTFKTHLGRPSTWNYPGWFRSYGFAAKYAAKFQFKKIIHIESDAFLFSKNIINYINGLNSGWTSFWSNQYNFPETAIQVICEDQINNFFWFATQKYNTTHVNKPIETITPFTNINKRFKGDRYSEFLASLPDQVDFCCQFPVEWKFPK